MNNNYSNKISANSFYNEYHGHKINDLLIVHNQLKHNNQSIIYLAGDSSLDNKFWFDNESEAGIYSYLISWWLLAI